MLANPSKTDALNEGRRQAVRKHVIALNGQLEAACKAAAVPCRFDGVSGVPGLEGGRVFNTKFERSDVSSADYFHPSRYGQAKLAAATYAAFGPFTAQK
jgi:hypothetical protein